MPQYIFRIMHFHVRVYYFCIVYFSCTDSDFVYLFFWDSRLSSLQMKRLNFPSSIEYGQVLADNIDNNGQENYFRSSLVILLCLHE